MPIAVDTETTLATNAEPVPRVVSLAYASNAGQGLIAAHDPACVSVFRDALREGIVLANAPFDVYAMLRRDPGLFDDVIDAYNGGRIVDVITRDKMLSASRGERWSGEAFNLGAIAKRRAGLEVDKNDPWRKRYGELLGIDIDRWPPDAKRYAILDALATWAIYLAQEAERARARVDVFANASVQACGHLALYWQTLRGIHTDRERVEALDRSIAARMDKIGRELIDLGLARIGGTKKAPKVQRVQAEAMRWVAYEHEQRGLRCPVTKRGPSLSADTIDSLALPDDHPLEKYGLFGSLSALRSKSIPVFRKPIIRTRYDELKVTGRTGSSAPQGKRKADKLEAWEWCGTNLQNLAKPITLKKLGFAEGEGFRECLVPPPGHVFVISDWSGAELVTLAQVCLDWIGHSALAEIMRDPSRDLHGEVGADLIGVPLESFDRHNVFEHKKARDLAKAVDFGYPGGLGPKRFVDFARTQYGIKITEAEARRSKRVWQNKLPEMRPYHDLIGSLKDHDGKHTVILPRAGLVRGGCSFTEACNFPFQGLAAVAAKTALWWLWLAQWDESSPLHGCYQCLFVHDENVTVAPIDRAEAVKAEQERIMIEAFRVWCPDVPVRVESDIAERYKK